MAQIVDQSPLDVYVKAPGCKRAAADLPSAVQIVGRHLFPVQSEPRHQTRCRYI
jgi:hypothetical protein